MGQRQQITSGLSHAVVRLQAKRYAPGAGEGPDAGRLRRGGVALRFWRNPHGIRESVESVSVESAMEWAPSRRVDVASKGQLGN